MKKLNQPLFYSFLASLPFLIFAIVSSVNEQFLLQFDLPVSLGVASLRQEPLTSAMKGITNLMNPLPFTILVIVTMAILFFRGHKIKSLSFGIFIFVGSVLIMMVFKNIFQRPRPEVVHALINQGNFSFPSGHAINSTLFFGSIMWSSQRWLKNKTARHWLYIIGTALILVIGFSRIYLGVHYLSDILAGYSLATAYLILVVSIFQQKLYTKGKLKEE